MQDAHSRNVGWLRPEAQRSSGLTPTATGQPPPSLGRRGVHEALVQHARGGHLADQAGRAYAGDLEHAGLAAYGVPAGCQVPVPRLLPTHQARLCAPPTAPSRSTAIDCPQPAVSSRLCPLAQPRSTARSLPSAVGGAAGGGAGNRESTDGRPDGVLRGWKGGGRGGEGA